MERIIESPEGASEQHIEAQSFASVYALARQAVLHSDSELPLATPKSRRNQEIQDPITISLGSSQLHESTKQSRLLDAVRYLVYEAGVASESAKYVSQSVLAAVYGKNRGVFE